MRWGKSLKYCLAVPDFLGDLYICEQCCSAEAAVSTSQMRVGPIGLIEELGAEFIIVRDAHRQARSFLRSQEPIHIESRLEEIERVGIRGWREEKMQPKIYQYSVNAIDVDWSKYDVVVCINDIVPYRLRKMHAGTLFICMPADGILPKRFFGYDGLATQYSSLRWWRESRLVDVPYTYVGGNTLEKILARMGSIDRAKIRRQVFFEINTYKSRPIDRGEISGFAQMLEREGIEIGQHKEYVVDNLLEVRQSAYFVKLSGREIRGNSIFEAISCGCPVLIKRELCLDNVPLPEESYINTIDDVIRVMSMNDSDKYREELLRRQRSVIDMHVKDAFIKQIESLRRLVLVEREDGVAIRKKMSLRERAKDNIKLWCKCTSLSL